MSTFSSLQQRFFMRYVPEVMTTTTEDERQEAIANALIEHPFGWLQDKAMDFFLHASPEMHRREALTRLLGVGDQRLYHVEHNLTDVPMREMPTLYSMVKRRATINAHLLSEDDDTFDIVSYAEAQQNTFNLWLSDFRDDALRFIVANSISMEHAFIAQELINDAMEANIPREVLFDDVGTGIQVHIHVEGDLHQKIFREMTRRCMKRAEKWINLMNEAATAMGHPHHTVAVNEEIDEYGYPLTTYCFFSAPTLHHVRLAHWGNDVDHLLKVSLTEHRRAIRERFEQPITKEITALYHELIKENLHAGVTPMYSRDTGNKIFLSPTFFDKS